MLQARRASYLAGLAGVVEGVDVLDAEAHHATVDVIEVRAPGRVAVRTAWRGGRCGGLPGRPQEPGQNAEQREPRAATHDGRRAPARAPKHSHPWQWASPEAVLPKPGAALDGVSAQRWRCLVSSAGRGCWQHAGKGPIKY